MKLSRFVHVAFFARAFASVATLTRCRWLVLAVFVATGVGASTTGCSVATKPLCREPSDRCVCRSSNASANDSVLILTDRVSPALTQFVGQTVDAGKSGADLSTLGIGSEPAVTIVVYTPLGEINPVGRYVLRGEGDSANRRKANAEFNAACLRTIDDSDALPADAPPGDLLRALNKGTELARVGDPERAAMIAFGLGRSQSEGFPPMDELDLDTPARRAHAVEVWTGLGYLTPTEDVRVTFFAPDEDVADPIAAAAINTLVEDELCAAIGGGCQRLEVLT